MQDYEEDVSLAMALGRKPGAPTLMRSNPSARQFGECIRNSVLKLHDEFYSLERILMRIEKRCVLPFPVEIVWDRLSNAEVVGTCVPGVTRVEKTDDRNFVVTVTVKVGVIKPTFRLNVELVEQNPPVYLRSTCAGEANGMMGSLRGTTQIRLTALDGGATEVDVQADGDVFGRLGTFGYSVLKGKADQLWDDFVANLTGAMKELVASA